MTIARAPHEGDLRGRAPSLPLEAVAMDVVDARDLLAIDAGVARNRWREDDRGAGIEGKG